MRKFAFVFIVLTTAFSSPIERIVCKTSAISGSGMKIGSVDFNVTNSNGYFCEIGRLNDFYDGENTTLVGEELQECDGFELPGDTVPNMVITHHGTDMWRWDYILFELDNLLTLTCTDGIYVNGEIDGGQAITYVCY